MARSGINKPKPLLTIGSRTLLEHNVAAMLESSIDRIYVSVRADAEPVRQCVTERCVRQAAAHGVPLEPLVEQEALGNIGALGQVPGSVDLAIVCFADNLTALRLSQVIEHHRRTNAALTLAAHMHTFVMPFGELLVDGTKVASYTEKPSTRSLVSSAVTVASPIAIEITRRAAPLGLADLTNRLLAGGESVQAFHHEAPWIDINDQSALQAAETLIETEREAFSWFFDEYMIDA